MGMFDSIYVPCPTCGADVEFQSKASDCLMDRYTLEDAPPAILGDLKDAAKDCRCGTTVKINVVISAFVSGERE